MERIARRGGSRRNDRAKRVLVLIIVAALLTAGIIVLAWLALRHMLLKPLSASIAQLSAGIGRFNAQPEYIREPGV